MRFRDYNNTRWWQATVIRVQRVYVYELLSSTQLLVAVNGWRVALLVLLLSSNGSQEASGKGKGVHFVSATTATTQLKLAKLLCGDEPSMPCATWNVLFQSLEANENLPIGTSGNLQKSFLFKKMKNQSLKGPSSNTHLKHSSAQGGNEEWYSPNASTFYDIPDIPVYPSGFLSMFYHRWKRLLASLVICFNLLFWEDCQHCNEHIHTWIILDRSSQELQPHWTSERSFLLTPLQWFQETCRYQMSGWM